MIREIATKLLAMKPEFDVARDQDGDAVGTTKFCMISLGEWRSVRKLATLTLTGKGRRKK